MILVRQDKTEKLLSIGRWYGGEAQGERGAGGERRRGREARKERGGEGSS